MLGFRDTSVLIIKESLKRSQKSSKLKLKLHKNVVDRNKKVS